MMAQGFKTYGKVSLNLIIGTVGAPEHAFKLHSCIYIIL